MVLSLSVLWLWQRCIVTKMSMSISILSIFVMLSQMIVLELEIQSSFSLFYSTDCWSSILLLFVIIKISKCWSWRILNLMNLILMNTRLRNLYLTIFWRAFSHTWTCGISETVLLCVKVGIEYWVTKTMMFGDFIVWNAWPKKCLNQIYCRHLLRTRQNYERFSTPGILTTVQEIFTWSQMDLHCIGKRVVTSYRQINNNKL